MSDKISFASPKDAPAILALEEECFSLPHTLCQIEHEIDDGIHHYLCARENGILIGYVSYSLIADEIYIGNVAVELEFRRQGIGSSMSSSLRPMDAAPCSSRSRSATAMLPQEPCMNQKAFST